MNPKNIFLKETVKDEQKIQKIYSFPNGYGASVIKGPSISSTWTLKMVF